MPTYEYICSKCGSKFEVFQSIKDAPLKVCPEELCGQKRWGKGKVKRLISSGAGIIFKGSGFYCTDYRSESYRTAAKKESEVKTSPKAGAEGGGGTASAKGESKPAAAAKTA
jgi:putative FmdB family regulatory protein